MPSELSDLFKKIEHLDSTNWWILSKREIIGFLIKKFIPAGSSLLNVGCGSCNLGNGIFSQYTVEGVDDSKDMVDYCRARGIGARRGSAAKLPFPDGSFDGVLCFDVLEHLPDDEAAEKELFRVLKKGGMLIASVPASKILFRSIDIRSGHYRRYEKKELRSLLKRFRIVSLFYWNYLLFFPVLLRALLDKPFLSRASKGDILQVVYGEEIESKKLVNNLLLRLLRLENKLIVKGINFPFGISLIVVAKKQSF